MIELPLKKNDEAYTMIEKHDHVYKNNLWHPMNDGTGRWQRICDECGMIIVSHGEPGPDDYYDP